MKDLAKWGVAYHKVIAGISPDDTIIDYWKVRAYVCSLPTSSLEELLVVKDRLSRYDFLMYLNKSAENFAKEKSSLFIQKEIHLKFMSVGKDIIRNAFDYSRFSAEEVELLKDWIESLSPQQIWENIIYIQAVGRNRFAESVRLIIVSAKEVAYLAK